MELDNPNARRISSQMSIGDLYNLILGKQDSTAHEAIDDLINLNTIKELKTTTGGSSYVMSLQEAETEGGKRRFIGRRGFMTPGKASSDWLFESTPGLLSGSPSDTLRTLTWDPTEEDIGRYTPEELRAKNVGLSELEKFIEEMQWQDAPGRGLFK